MNIHYPNFSIVVNWRAKGFGCAKACSYCTWKESPLLPHGGQRAEMISSFVKQCRKSFITISGGADPLYRIDQYGDQLLAMIDTIKQHGFKVRVITRELQAISRLSGIVDYISISLDPEVLDAVDRHQQDWGGMDIEYSLVLPPLATADIVRLKPQYAALHRRLGKRLVLRENLNSIFSLDMKQLSFGHKGIVFVPKPLCLAGRYLSTIDCVGHEIVQDHARLADYLMTEPNAYLFGGFVKHILDPRLEYSDIDLVALDESVMRTLEMQFRYTFKEASRPTNNPRVFVGKSALAGKAIHLVLLRSQTEALQFIHNAQYDLDRVAYSAERFHFDPAVGEIPIRRALKKRLATPVQGPRYMGLFTPIRVQVEQRHKAKLLSKGYSVND
jgi:hypothetical protein